MAGWIRLWVRVGAMVLLAVPCIPLHYLWRLIRISSPWPRIFLWCAGRICGARARVRGVPLKRDVFYIANHVSWIDILAIAGASGTAFVAKAEIRDAPVVGWLASLNRTVFVERENRLGVAGQINALRDTLAENWSVTVFPEGTTNDGKSLLPFKTSMLKVLEPPPPGVMVQPVLLDYGFAGEEIAWLGVESGKDNAIRVLSRRGAFPVVVHFLEPFHPRDFPGRKSIAAESRRRIEVAFADVLGHPVPPFVGHEVWAAKGVAAAKTNPSALLPLDEAELGRRKPVWSALSDLFLDTDVSLSREYDARILAESPYSIEQIERILLDEVSPACIGNLRSVAGEWAGFPDNWLVEQITTMRAKPGSGRRSSLIEDDWLLLRAAIVARRDGALAESGLSG